MPMSLTPHGDTMLDFDFFRKTFVSECWDGDTVVFLIDKRVQYVVQSEKHSPDGETISGRPNEKSTKLIRLLSTAIACTCSMLKKGRFSLLNKVL